MGVEMMGYQDKRRAAEAHNKAYAEKKTAPHQETANPVNVGTVGHVDHRRQRTLQRALLPMFIALALLEAE